MCVFIRFVTPLIAYAHFPTTCGHIHHVVLFHPQDVWTFGRDYGQLGYSTSSGGDADGVHVIDSPRVVPFFHGKGRVVAASATSTVTACLTGDGDVVVMQDHTCRRLPAPTGYKARVAKVLCCGSVVMCLSEGGALFVHHARTMQNVVWTLPQVVTVVCHAVVADVNVEYITVIPDVIVVPSTAIKSVLGKCACLLECLSHG